MASGPKKWLRSRGTILKPEEPEGADASEISLAQLQYFTIDCTNFQKNRCKIVGVCDIKLLEFDTKRYANGINQHSFIAYSLTVSRMVLPVLLCAI